MIRPLTKEIKPLTALRMIAALLVFLHHYNCVDNQCAFGRYPLRAATIWESIAVEGHIGVTIFFVLSGFLITLRYYPDIAARHFTIRPYFQRRIARIYPLYYVLLIVSLLWTGDLLNRHSLINLTLLQGLFDSLKFTGIATAWSLTVEEMFYLLAPLVFLTIAYAARRFAFVVLALWTLGLFLIGWKLQGLTPGMLGFMANANLMIQFTLFGRFIDFAFGIGAALLYLSERQPQSSLNATLIAVSAVVGIVLSEYLMNRAGGADAAWQFNLPVGLCAALLMLALTCERAPLSRLLSFSPLVYLGRVSYAVYLLQLLPPFFVLVSTPALQANALLLLYIVVTLVGVLCYELIEKPGQRFVMRWRPARAQVLEPLDR